MRAALAGAAVLAALAGAVPATAVRRAPHAARSPASQCRAGETIVFSCRLGRSTASVCAAPGGVAYRFGPLGKPALEIAGDAGWRNVRLGRVTGGGGGYQDHLRFSAADHDYVVYESAAGNLTDIPGQHWSGILVQRGDAELANLACEGRPILARGGLRDVARFAPAGAAQGLDDTDPRFDAWF